LPNVGPYIYDVSISGFTRSSIYIHDISSLRVKINLQRSVLNIQYDCLGREWPIGKLRSLPESTLQTVP